MMKVSNNCMFKKHSMVGPDFEKARCLIKNK